MAVFSRSGRHRVAVFARQMLLPIELGIVHQLFGQARAGASVAGEPLYEVVTCALEPGEVRTDGDFAVAVRCGPEALDEADTVVVLSSYEDYEDYEDYEGDEGGESEPSGLLRAALARIRPGARIASICTGAFVLASAGLLDGRTATTHWRFADLFARRFPRVRLEPDVLYTDGGEVLTSAGCAAGIDLCLHMIRCDHGAAVAGDVARRTVVPPHREGGQVQYVRRPMPEPSSPATSAARSWSLEHLHEPITLRQMAAREAMSVRNLTRRFRDEVGMTPMSWLTGQRIERARELLEGSDLSVDQIAERCGLGTAANMRQHFQAALGTSPSAYRSTFRVPEA